MSHVTRVASENLSGRRMDLALSPKTILIGQEEAGKTTAINALRLACRYGIPELGQDHQPGQLLQLVSGSKASVTVCMEDGFSATSILKRTAAGGSWETRCSPGPASTRNEEQLPCLRAVVGVRPVSVDVAAWLDVDEKRLRSAILGLIGATARISAADVVDKIRERMPDVGDLGFAFPAGDPLDALEALATSVDKARIAAESARRDASDKAKEPLPEPPDAQHGIALAATLAAAVERLAGLRVALGAANERERSRLATEGESYQLRTAIAEADLGLEQLRVVLARLPVAPEDVAGPSAEEIEAAQAAVTTATTTVERCRAEHGAAKAAQTARYEREAERSRAIDLNRADTAKADQLRSALAALPVIPEDEAGPAAEDIETAADDLRTAELELRAANDRLASLRLGLDAGAEAQQRRQDLVSQIAALEAQLSGQSVDLTVAMSADLDRYRERLGGLGIEGLRAKQAELTAGIDALRTQIEERRATLAERQGALRSLEAFAGSLELGQCPVLNEACDRLAGQSVRLVGAREAVTKQQQALDALTAQRTAIENERRPLVADGRALADLEASLKLQIASLERQLIPAQQYAAQQQATRFRIEGELAAKRQQMAGMPSVEANEPEGMAAARESVAEATHRRDRAMDARDSLAADQRNAAAANARLAKSRQGLEQSAANLRQQLATVERQIAERTIPDALPVVDEALALAALNDALAKRNEATKALAAIRNDERIAVARNVEAAERRIALAAQASDLRQQMAAIEGAQSERSARLAALPSVEAVDLAGAEAAVTVAAAAEAVARSNEQAHLVEVRRLQDARDAREQAEADVERLKIRRERCKELLRVVHDVQAEILQATLAPLVSRVVPYVPARVQLFEIDLSAGGCKPGFRMDGAFVPWRAVAESLRIAWLFALAAAVADLEKQPLRLGLLDGLYRVAPGRQPEILDCLSRLQADALVDQLVVTAHELPAGWDPDGWTVIRLVRPEPAAVNADVELEEVAAGVAL